ncbi:MAG: putative AMP-dependent synthetase and ligase [Phenylobacterium sp.]|nr:putative AMP-dependent synthetase and ligase [Phenylobacterium sp.]
MPTLVDKLYAHARERAGEPALRDSRRCLSWTELDAQTNRIANALAAAGVGKGMRVAIMADADVAGALLILGTLKAGASAVPVPTLIGADAIARVLDDCAAKILFVSARCRGLLTPEIMNLPLAHVAIDFRDGGWPSLEDFVAEARVAAPDIAIAPQDEFNIIYSSGTTGRPKGIVHSHGLRASWSAGMADVSFPTGVRTLTTTALYSNWTLGALIYTLWAGGCVHLMDKFSPAALVRDCRDAAPDNVFLVPVQIARLLDDPTCANALPGLPPATKWSAGSHLSAEHKRELMRLWPGRFIELYGMTEGGPSTMLFGDERPDKLHTVGCSDAPDSIRIIDDDGHELGPNCRGEIVGRAVEVMDGYNNDPAATEALIWRDAQGEVFFRSGDTGCLDEDGFLQILDRKKDMIISGGFNIYAVDLEEVLLAHPSVSQAAVFAIPSTRWGESPAAAVVLKPRMATQDDEIRRWANARLGRLQHLSAVTITDDLPRGGLGKVLKRELRATYAHLGDATVGNT